MSTHQNCLVCNSTNITPMSGYEESYLVKCANCTFVFAQKIPTEKELNDHYSKTYTREDYLSPITVKRYHELLDRFEAYRSTNRILDIGCGVGYFLDVAKERGWDVYGTEFTDESMKINSAKGFKMNQGKLDANKYESSSFDIVTSFEVIEHIHNPREEITQVKTILRSGGLFYCTTPNFNSLSRWQLKEKWNVIVFPEHLSYYTPKSMHQLLSSFTMEKKEVLTTGISITRFKKSHDKTIIESHITGESSDEKLRVQMESKWYMGLIKGIINSSLTLFGIGDSLKVMYVKR